MIIPVYGTAIRISAQILAKISSLILLSKAEGSKKYFLWEFLRSAVPPGQVLAGMTFLKQKMK